MVNLHLPEEATFKGPATLWSRIGAFLIDLMVLDLVLGNSLQSILASIVPAGDFKGAFAYVQAHSQAAVSLSLVMISFGILALLYFSFLEYKLGQTIGKIFMRIKVESLTKKAGFFSYLVRNMCLLLIFPFNLLLIIDPLFMLFSREGRRLGEILSKTRTIAVYQLR